MNFKPSDVRMWRAPHLPLIDTFGRSEREFAACLMVLACRANGDTWDAVTPRQVGLAMKAAAEDGGELHHLKANPFCPHPDMRDLVAKGFAAFDGDADEGAPIRFTADGLAVLAKTVSTPSSEPPR